MTTPLEPAVQAAILNIIAATVLGVGGWIVASKIAKAARDAAQAIADVTAGITRQQLSVANSQKEINHQALILNLMPKRVELEEELKAAITAREEEIIKTNYAAGHYPIDALTRIWKAEYKAKALFGPDVIEVISAILKKLNEKQTILSEIRTNPKYDRSLHNKVADVSFQIVDLLGVLSTACLTYSSLGHVKAHSNNALTVGDRKATPPTGTSKA